MENSNQSTLLQLSTSTAVTAAVALAEYASFWDLLNQAKEEDAEIESLVRVQEMVREQALMLLMLARSISEYGKYLGDLPTDEDPRILLPLLQEIGQSYAIVGLATSASEIQTDLLLSPERLEHLLGSGVAEFISRYGEEEAVQVLAERAASLQGGAE